MLIPLGSGPGRLLDRTCVLASKSSGRTLIRKTSFASDRSDGVRSSSRHKTPRVTFITHDARRLRIDHDFHHDRLSERSYLFTMSDITRPHEASRLDDGCERLYSLRTSRSPGWWSQTGSNRRPPACKAGALPTELWPLPGFREQISEISAPPPDF